MLTQLILDPNIDRIMSLWNGNGSLRRTRIRHAGLLLRLHADLWNNTRQSIHIKSSDESKTVGPYCEFTSSGISIPLFFRSFRFTLVLVLHSSSLLCSWHCCALITGSKTILLGRQFQHLLL